MRVTIVLVGAVRVAVDDAGLSVCGPASVSDAKVREELLLQVQRIFLWRRNGNVSCCARGYRGSPKLRRNQACANLEARLLTVC